MPEFFRDQSGISVDGVYPFLLWLSEESCGIYATGPVLGYIIWERGQSFSDVYRDLSQEPFPSVGQVMDALAQFDCDK